METMCAQMAGGMLITGVISIICVPSKCFRFILLFFVWLKKRLIPVHTCKDLSFTQWALQWFPIKPSPILHRFAAPRCFAVKSFAFGPVIGFYHWSLVYIDSFKNIGRRRRMPKLWWMLQRRRFRSAKCGFGPGDCSQLKDYIVWIIMVQITQFCIRTTLSIYRGPKRRWICPEWSPAVEPPIYTDTCTEKCHRPETEWHTCRRATTRYQGPERMVCWIRLRLYI